MSPARRVLKLSGAWCVTVAVEDNAGAVVHSCWFSRDLLGIWTGDDGPFAPLDTPRSGTLWGAVSAWLELLRA